MKTPLLVSACFVLKPCSPACSGINKKTLVVACSFNEASGEKLSRNTFSGYSQGWTGGYDKYNVSTVTSYANGQNCFFFNCGKTLYTGILTGFSLGLPIPVPSVRYYYSDSKLIDSLSISFK